MGSGIALDNAAIMSVVLEAILYGFSLLMFIGTVWIFVRGKGYNALHRTMITIAVTLLVLSTSHMIVNIVLVQEGLVKYRDTFPGGPNTFFGDFPQNTFVMKTSIYISQTLLGDSVVIYRCYVVWQSIWIIILPSMLWCSVAVTGIRAVYDVSQATGTNDTNIFIDVTSRWITAFFALTLATNLLSTGLLAYRIWAVQRDVSSMQTSKNTMNLMPIIRVLVDSAALVSATLLAALLTFVTSNNGQFVLIDILMPIISIAFYLVLVRIAMHRAQLNYVSNTSSADRWATTVEPGSTRPLRVHISKHSRSDAIQPYPFEDNGAFERDRWLSTNKVRQDCLLSHIEMVMIVQCHV